MTIGIQVPIRPLKCLILTHILSYGTRAVTCRMSTGIILGIKRKADMNEWSYTFYSSLRRQGLELKRMNTLRCFNLSPDSPQ
jgi:hypothetical protein